MLSRIILVLLSQLFIGNAMSWAGDLGNNGPNEEEGTATEQEFTSVAVPEDGFGALRNLPGEVIVMVLFYLDPKDVLQFGIASKSICQFLDDCKLPFDCDFNEKNGAALIRLINSRLFFHPRSMRVACNDQVADLLASDQFSTSRLKTCPFVDIPNTGTIDDAKLVTMIRAFPELTSLCLGSNDSSQSPTLSPHLATLGNCPIKTLVLLGIQVQGTHLVNLVKNCSLKTLRINRLECLTGEGDMTEEGVQKALEVIDLEGCEISNQVFPWVASMHDLKSLRIQAGFQSDHPRPFEVSSHLKTLLTNNQHLNHLVVGGIFAMDESAWQAILAQNLSSTRIYVYNMDVLGTPVEIFDLRLCHASRALDQGVRVTLPSKNFDRAVFVITELLKRQKRLTIHVTDDEFQIYEQYSERPLQAQIWLSGNITNPSLNKLLEVLPDTIEISAHFLNDQNLSLARNFMDRLLERNFYSLEFRGDYSLDNDALARLSALSKSHALEISLWRDRGDGKRVMQIRRAWESHHYHQKGISVHAHTDDNGNLPMDFVTAILSVKGIANISFVGYQDLENVFALLPSDHDFTRLSFNLNEKSVVHVKGFLGGFQDVMLSLDDKPQLHLDKLPGVDGKRISIIRNDSPSSRDTVKSIELACSMPGLKVLSLLGIDLDEEMARVLRTCTTLNELHVGRIASASAARYLNDIKTLVLESWDRTVPQKLRALTNLEELRINGKDIKADVKNDIIRFAREMKIKKTLFFRLIEQDRNKLEIEVGLRGHFSAHADLSMLDMICHRSLVQSDGEELRMPDIISHISLIDTDITDDLLVDIPFAAAGVKTLDLSGSNLITLAGIMKIIAMCPKLDSIVLPAPLQGSETMLTSQFSGLNVKIADN